MKQAQKQHSKKGKTESEYWKELIMEGELKET